jgi:hypothetical protein
MEYAICHDGTHIIGVWMSFRNETNFVTFQDSQVMDIKANAELISMAQRRSGSKQTRWTHLQLLTAVDREKAPIIAASKIATFARNEAKAAVWSGSQENMSKSHAPIFLATVDAFSRFVNLDGQPFGPFGGIIYKWPSPPLSITLIFPNDSRKGMLIGFCRESIELLDASHGGVVQSVQHSNHVRCLTDSRRGRIFLGSWKNFPGKFSNMYYLS